MTVGKKIYKLWLKVVTSEGLKQSMFNAFGNVAASGFSAISLIVISRYLGPTGFGAFSVAFSLTQIVARISDVGLNLALQKFVANKWLTDRGEASTAIWIVGIVKIITVVLVLVVGVVGGRFIGSDWLKLTDPTLAVWGIALAGVIVLYEYVLVIFQSISRFVTGVVLNAIQAVGKCLMAIISLQFMLSSVRFTYGWYGIIPLLSVGAGWLIVPRNLFVKPIRFTKVAKSLFSVAKFASVAVFAAAISDNIDVVMVKSSLNEYQTGLYAAAARIALMATLFGLSLGTVLNTRVAKYSSKENMDKYLKKATGFSLFMLLMTPIMIWLAKPLLLISAGSQYIQAEFAMQLLLVGAMVTMASMPFIAVFYCLDYPIYFAITGLLQMIMLIGGNYLLIPTLGINGAAWTKLIMRLVVALYTVIMGSYLIRKKWKVKTLPFVQI